MFRFPRYTVTDREEGEEMNYDGLITAVLFVFAGITAVNLVIQFFQFAAEERKKCSIIRTEPKNIKKVKFCGSLSGYRQGKTGGCICDTELPAAAALNGQRGQARRAARQPVCPAGQKI